MYWYNGEEASTFNYPAHDVASTIGSVETSVTSRMQSTAGNSFYPQFGWHSTLAGSCYGLTGSDVVGNTSQDIQLLNDDHEKAILRDLCKPAGTESTPLTTFSYISEYICSNNIDIWPGEVPTASGTSGTVCRMDSKLGEQSLPMASCIHHQVYLRCKRVLETIIARNEQILATLRPKHLPDGEKGHKQLDVKDRN